MKIKVVAVGQLKERFWKDACTEYLKRLRAYANVTVVELPDVSPERAGGERQAVEREGKSVLDALDASEHVILLDIKGKAVSSEDMASALESLTVDGISSVAFVIGGSCGVSDEVRKRANARWSFGRITLPHNLARVVALEQIYRAFRIIRHEPYHK
ncbi:MAG: 23S rRNA (pseudouridine(1915)-N(3))-methyltransferase RlmH [Eggerthellaceae bacterium]|nr:23S rRNA (pseudouridine(1915)-N(3))-methyltransferase RlmH [Eggerthellaceae bacterium]